MRLSAIRVGVLVATSSLAFAGAAGAQPAGQPRAAADQQTGGGPQNAQARVQISVMERMLERAVGEGIVSTRGQMPEVFSVPLMLEGNNRVRGFKVNGYGVFFDVEVPALPKSMMWSLRVMSRGNDAVILKELNDLRALVARSVTDPKERAEAQQRIVVLESRVRGVAPPVVDGQAPATRTVSSRGGAAQPPPVAVIAPTETKDPDAVYVAEVKNALINAMLDHSTAIPIAADEVLTVAARGSDAQAPDGLNDAEPNTVYLTIKGQDLLALRAGQITREEARRRVRESAF